MNSHLGTNPRPQPSALRQQIHGKLEGLPDNRPYPWGYVLSRMVLACALCVAGVLAIVGLG